MVIGSVSDSSGNGVSNSLTSFLRKDSPVLTSSLFSSVQVSWRAADPDHEVTTRSVHFGIGQTIRSAREIASES